MKLSCSRSALAAAFQTVSGVIPTRTPKPILQNVKLEATAGHAVLIGTDQEVRIRYRLAEPNIEVAGEELLAPTRLLAIQRAMQGAAVLIRTTESGAVISAEGAKS